jgi:hypothetical protein
VIFLNSILTVARRPMIGDSGLVAAVFVKRAATGSATADPPAKTCAA